MYEWEKNQQTLFPFSFHQDLTNKAERPEVELEFFQWLLRSQKLFLDSSVYYSTHH
jgi:hypothetical protein